MSETIERAPGIIAGGAGQRHILTLKRALLGVGAAVVVGLAATYGVQYLAGRPVPGVHR